MLHNREEELSHYGLESGQRDYWGKYISISYLQYLEDIDFVEVPEDYFKNLFLPSKKRSC